nr:hypothetical protein [Tanacetum cinerariifolium]
WGRSWGRYVSGLPDNIYGSVKASKPKTLDETIELANDLMDQKLCTYAERQSNNKRMAGHFARECRSSHNANVVNAQRNNGANPKGNGCFECRATGHFKRDCPKLKNKDGEKCHPLNFKETEGAVGLTHWIEKMESIFNISGCAMDNQVDKYISGLPDNIYGNVKSSKPKTLDETIELANDLMDQKLRTYAERKSDSKRKADDISRNNQSTGNTNATNNRGGNGPNPRGNGCFECGNLGHLKRDCPKLNNKNVGNGNAQGWVYAVGNTERNGNAAENPDSNIVTELGSFDAIIGKDWLRRHHAVIVCDEKAKGCHVFLAQISATKEDGKPERKQVKDVPIAQDFPDVFPEDLPGLPPARPVEF